MRRAQFVVDHRFTRRRLSAYIDGELEPRERQRVERHIPECRDCRFMTRSLRRMLAALAGLRRCVPSRQSADLRARLGSR
jgi:anti-sigma factor RsiW